MLRMSGFRIWKGADVLWDKRRGVPLTPRPRSLVFAARRVAESAVGIAPDMNRYVSVGKDGKRVTVVPSLNKSPPTVRVAWGEGDFRTRVDLILREVGDGQNEKH